MDESVYISGRETQGYYFSKVEFCDEKIFVKKRCVSSGLSYVQVIPHHRFAFHFFASIERLALTAFHQQHQCRNLADINAHQEPALNSHGLTRASNQCPPMRLSSQIEPITNSNLDSLNKRKTPKEGSATHKCGKFGYEHPGVLRIIHRLIAQGYFLRSKTSQNRPRFFAIR